MLTYGLNRPLFSFGLAYPGYFFVVVPESSGKFTIYKVHEANRFRASIIARKFLARFANSYIAVATPSERASNYYVVLESTRHYTPVDKFKFQAVDAVLMKVFEQSREFSATDSNDYIVAELPRRFKAREETEYAEIYRR